MVVNDIKELVTHVSTINVNGKEKIRTKDGTVLAYKSTIRGAHRETGFH